MSSVVLRRVISRALRAASRARAASIILPAMILATDGFSSRNSSNFSFIAPSTADLTSEETSLSLVCEENFGSGTLTERMAVKPSRESSPVVATLCFFCNPWVSMYWFRVRVSAARKPAKWVPPSRCGILLV